jgi:hypothetical protein
MQFFRDIENRAIRRKHQLCGKDGKKKRSTTSFSEIYILLGVTRNAREN